MALTSASDDLTVTPPALPKAGGSLPGMPISPGAVGPDGQATLAIPLPISPGRGYAPNLSLQYQSAGSNGLFGSGWQCAVPSIRRRTDRGVPSYTDQDVFLAPDGEALVPERNAQGQVVSTTTSTFATQPLERAYQVTRYFPQVESSFARIERWQASGVADFWLIHQPSGELLCLGKSAQARIADAAAAQTRIVSWLAEESVSPRGEHIYYRYVSAAEVGVTDTGGRDTQNQRVLSAVSYGNVTARSGLWIWQADTAPAEQQWLFTLVLDYGARGTDSSVPPAFRVAPNTPSPLRQDAFSRYDAGFEIRTHWLCRQVLMFHHFAAELGEPATLVKRLALTYDENPLLSRLVGAQSLAYEADATHTLQCLPPLEFDYTAFCPDTSPAAWQPLRLPDDLGLTGYRLVDLYGEGIPGLLFQTGGAWYYRAAIRDTSAPATPDAVTYGALTQLPLVPSLYADHGINLLDLDGDGRLEWLVTLPSGIAGYYRLNADRSWSGFTPLSTFALEYLHPAATLADVRSTGLPDLAMIGPRSVRLYVNEGTGFAAACNVAHDGDEGLPVTGADRQELVVFADMLGSGQAHLVSVRNDRVRCWPNLGGGRFGSPLILPLNPPLDAGRFAPRQVYLADIDGSGTTDLLYADADGIHLYLNQAGNALASPITLAYPAGLCCSQLSPLQLVDLNGQGTLSLVLTQLTGSPDGRPRHWRFDLCSTKPYLLNNVSNNCGASTFFTYRSSAQEWLDEKHSAPTATAGIPFPTLLLDRVEQHCDVTGAALIRRYQYRRGYWDSTERELRGFGYVESLEWDSRNDALAAMPLRSCRWYHTGRAEDACELYGTPYHDPDAFPTPDTRLTRWQGDADDGQDVELTPDTATAWWLHRALKGSLLREEQYGLDSTPAAAIPYRVSQARPQARLVQAGTPAVVLPLDAGSTFYTYERVASDPQVTQAVPLHVDGYGHLLWSINLFYPRRLDAKAANPYAGTALPAEAFSATFDPQQTLLRLSENRLHVRNQPDPQAWLLGVPIATRQNAITYPAEQSPASGFTLETLSAPDGLLGAAAPRELLAQQQTHYYSDPALPSTLALRDHSETARLTATDLTAYASVLTDAQCQELLRDGGYQRMPALLPVPGGTTEADLWAANTDYTTYLGADQFWRVHTQTAAQLPAADGQLPLLTLSWDRYQCCLLGSTDVYGNTLRAAIDYRFLMPWQLCDINANLHEVQLDALGRVVASSFYGTELGPDGSTAVKVGFSALQASPAPLQQSVPAAVAAALAINQGSGRQPQASRSVYNAFSLMGQLSVALLRPLVADDCAAKALYQHLQALRYITAQGHVLCLAWRWAQGTTQTPGVPATLRALLLALPRQPVHSAALLADAYPDAAQQVGVQISHCDGFGRPLQTATLQPDGLAWQRSPSGNLVLENERPLEAQASPRWSIGGRVEYTARGEVGRTFQPYFMNDWQWVNTAVVRASGYADTHTFDASGRETAVVTALGWQRRQAYTPWFTVAEDENDTANTAGARP